MSGFHQNDGQAVEQQAVVGQRLTTDAGALAVLVSHEGRAARVGQKMEAAGFFDGVQIGALDILD